MDTLEKVEITASIRHIARFLQSRIPIHSSDFPDTDDRKTRQTRSTQAIAKYFAFYAKAIKGFIKVENSTLFVSIFYSSIF